MTATAAFKSYLMLVPKLAEGATTSISSQLASVDTETSGKKLGSKLGNGIKTGLAAAGVAAAAAAASAVAIGKSALEAYASYEQLVGGVDTLFEESSQRVQDYAANAYRTAGLSANAYMETVTSFSASLLQSLGGDTQAAADYADMAVTDMADNANKMGTAMTSIEDAYKGFSKQNYTMLDNLKLGYGGTKTEMERLLEDATALSGIEYDIDSYSDIVSAIHVIQEEMGIAGTTAKEASETIEGSISSAQAAWTNWLTGLGSDSADLGALTDQLVDSVITAAGNILPRLSVILNSAGSAIATGIPQLLPEVVAAITSSLPSLVQSGAELVTGIVAALPEIIKGLLDALPEVIDSLATGLAENAPALLAGALECFGALASALIEIVPQLVAKIPEIVISLGEEIIAHRGDIADAGLDMIKGLGEGILNAKDWLIGKIQELCGNALDAIKSFFGIASPSKVMRQQGAYLMQGFALGIEDSASLAERAMDTAMAGVGGVTVTAAAATGRAASGSTTNIYIDGARINDDTAMESACYAFLTELQRHATMQGVA